MQQVRAALLSFIVLTGCETSALPIIGPSDVMPLLNSGEVIEMGITHKGLLIFKTRNGKVYRSKAELIGYPDELLAACSNCKDLTYWME